MVQAINRAFELVRLVAAAADGLRLRELAEGCGLKKTTVFNLAETLVAEGMLEKRAGAVYRLGPLVTELYLGGRGNRNLRRMAAQLSELHRLFPAASIVYTELGDADIFGRINLPPRRPGVIEFTDGMTLNPYTTVCGVLYFAYVPEERLNGLKIRNPFEYKGMEAWGSEENFRAQVETARRRGWAETPQLIRPEVFKVGIPVLDRNRQLVGTITFTVERAAIPPAEETRDAILTAAARIGSEL